MNTCDEARVAVSRQLDHDLPAAEAVELDGHLSTCADCRAWREQALFLQRAVRAGASQPPARFVLAAAGPRAVVVTLVIRALLAGVSVAGIVLAAPSLSLGEASPLMHESHELGSLLLALWAGMLVAAWRPERARGVLAIIGAAAVLLCVTAVNDIGGGGTTVAHEAPHALSVIGAALVWALARRTPERHPVTPLRAPRPVTVDQTAGTTAFRRAG